MMRGSGYREHLDTLSMVRGVGARVAAAAALRRITSDVSAGARSCWRRITGTTTPPGVLAGALRVMPSPLAEEDDEGRLELLERERPGSLTAIRERAAQAVAADVEVADPGDPRSTWEPHRLARLVAIGAGVRAAAGP